MQIKKHERKSKNTNANSKNTNANQKVLICVRVFWLAVVFCTSGPPYIRHQRVCSLVHRTSLSLHANNTWVIFVVKIKLRFKVKIIQSLNLISQLYLWCLCLLKDLISNIRHTIRLSLLFSGLKQRAERRSDSDSDNQQKAAAGGELCCWLSVSLS